MGGRASVGSGSILPVALRGNLPAVGLSCPATQLTATAVTRTERCIGGAREDERWYGGTRQVSGRVEEWGEGRREG